MFFVKSRFGEEALGPESKVLGPSMVMVSSLCSKAEGLRIDRRVFPNRPIPVASGFIITAKILSLSTVKIHLDSMIYQHSYLYVYTCSRLETRLSAVHTPRNATQRAAENTAHASLTESGTALHSATWGWPLPGCGTSPRDW